MLGMDTEAAYNKALDYLYSFVDYSLKKADQLAAANFNLDRMVELMASLGDPQQDYPTIHIAGTKGKGSVSAFCASALKAAGFRTGLYISPHLQDFNERMQVNDIPIRHAELAELVEEIKPHVARIPRLTTFELTTALGFLYFSRQKVDAAVIEVGLGGRLDATNILTPLVSVITSLSYDHMAVLGNTLTEIAGEKAGIIKPGIPVVSSPQQDEAQVVLERVAARQNAPFARVGRELMFTQGAHSLDGQHFQLWEPGEPKRDYFTPLLGAYQVENAATAFLALRRSGLEISNEAIEQGFARVRWPARFEIVRREPPVILDSAHNLDSARKLRQALDDYFPGRSVILVFGASEDKDVTGMFSEWKPRLSLVIACKADHPRALESSHLASLAGQVGIASEEASTVAEGFIRALNLAEEQRAVVLSAGSLFVTAEARTAWEKIQGKI